jgi:alpha-glucosidase
VNVQTALQNPDSILNFYRRLLRVRKQSEALRRGQWRTLVHYPHEHMVYLRETKTETVLVAINFSYEQSFKRDVEIDIEDWTVLLSTHYETGKLIDLADNLQSFEVSILQKIRED